MLILSNHRCLFEATGYHSIFFINYLEDRKLFQAKEKYHNGK
jgi:hypothetical protein